MMVKRWWIFVDLSLAPRPDGMNEKLWWGLVGLFLGAVVSAAALGAAEVRRRNRRRAERCAVERERRRIAGELHDAVGHGLVVIAMHSRRLPPHAGGVAQLIDETAQATLRDMRRIIGPLRGVPAPSDPDWSLSRRVTELVERAPANPPIRLEIAGDEPALPHEVRAAALHTVQEGISNALKYGSGPIELALDYGDPVRVTVTSAAGPQSEPVVRMADPNGGQGLSGLRERALRLGGTLECAPGHDGRFRIRMSLPTAVASVVELAGECESA
ncbi:sensor histidine kinase [Actinomadura kijaniata]|uniref:sensor histidine kinase n=1 Tax=Actinomadura kijaniata TaxID=46161 RepID=UPI003F1CC317